jgi:hypothetical protein
MGVPDILRVTQLSLVDHQFVTYMMSYLKSDRVRGNVHISSGPVVPNGSRMAQDGGGVKVSFLTGQPDLVGEQA